MYLQLSNEQLIEAYKSAVKLKLDKGFIDLLKEELKKRHIDRLDDEED